MTRPIVVLADLHCGSTLAPWPEDQPLGDGGYFQPGKVQKWLNVCWHTATREIGALEAPIVVLNGDTIHGNNPKDGQLITTLHSLQAAAAVRLLQPICDKAHKTYLIRGTEWHESKCSQDVEAVGRELGCVPNPHTGQLSWWELYLETDGGCVSFKHHISGSSRPTSETTGVQADLITLLGELARTYGRRGPDLRAIIRSHRHRSCGVVDPPRLQGWVTPGWQLGTAHGHKRCPVTFAHIGYTVIEQQGKDIVVKVRMFDYPAPHIEVA